MTAIASWLSDPERFPLRDPPEEVLNDLYRSLWSWVDCPQCMNNAICKKLTCPWTLRSSLQSYQQFYRRVTFRYTSEDWDESVPALEKHEDLFEVIRFIREHPHAQKRNLLSEYFDTHQGNRALTTVSKHRAFNLAFSALAMLPCADRNRHQDRYHTIVAITWRENESASAVMGRETPIGTPLSRTQACDITQRLPAERLFSRGFELSNTDDLRQHLYLDLAAKRVYIYHHAGFLKANIWAHAHGTMMQKPLISHQLALETLHTLRLILYAWDDLPSQALAAKKWFDLAGLDFDMPDYSDDVDDDKQYQYWGSRLLTLFEIVDGPRAGFLAQKWLLGKKSSRKERALVVLAILALVVAVVSGVVGPWMQSKE